MTLALANCYSSLNLGDAAIYETLAQMAGPAGASTSASPHAWRHVRGLAGAATGDPPSAWVSVGGDIFNNARPAFVTRRFLHNLRELAQLPPGRTFAFGQSIPQSCRGLSLHALALAMRRLSSVTVRDAASHARLRAHGVDAALSFDTAFALRVAGTSRQAGAELFAHAGADPARTVLISVRGFDAMYPHDNGVFVDRIAELAVRLRRRGHVPALIVQAAASGADCDAAVVDALRGRIASIPVLDPFGASAPHHPVDALCGALAQARGVVAVRYHTAVLRLLAGRMPYVLHYSNKGRDLVARLGVPGACVGAFDAERAVAGIENSMERLHDVSPQRDHVRHSFEHALAAAAGMDRAALAASMNLR